MTFWITAIGGVAATVLALWTVWEKVLQTAREWLDDPRIRRGLDTMDEQLEVARRLRVIGEEAWADEIRANAWMIPLRRTARFEVNRAHKARFFVAFTAWVLYLGPAVLLARHPDSPLVKTVMAAALVTAFGIFFWWLATKPRFEAKVRTLAEKKYQAKLEAGIVETVSSTRPSSSD